MIKRIAGYLFSFLFLALIWFPSFFPHQTPLMWLQTIALMIAVSWVNDW